MADMFGLQESDSTEPLRKRRRRIVHGAALARAAELGMPEVSPEEIGAQLSVDARQARAALQTQLSELQRQISAGPTHTCGVSAGGDGYCWGSNEEGELGLTTVDPVGLPGSAVPTRVFQNGYGGISFSQVSAGLHYTCAVSPAGSAYCWGRGAEGQTAEPALQRNATPRLVLAADGTFFADVSAGPGNHTCALTPYNGIYCWGTGEEGGLGTPGIPVTNSPSRVVIR